MQKIPKNSTYTYVFPWGNKILSRGILPSGDRFTTKVDYCPTFFIYSNKKKDTKYSDIHGIPVYDIHPGTIKECKEFISKYDNVHDYEILGMRNYQLQFISDNFPHDIQFNSEHLTVYTIDIETTTDYGFPDATNPREEILLITVFDSTDKKYHLFTSRNTILDDKLLIDNDIDINDVIIHLSDTEADLLRDLITKWQYKFPDVITGWNTNLFDIPYLVGRISTVLGNEYTNKLSPWGIIHDRKIKIGERELLSYNIIGCNHLDMIDLMKKYTYGGRESWKLDDVAYTELGKRKLEYDGSFADHYTKDWDHFCAYNLIDVALVNDLDAKFKFIDLAFTIAYMVKVNPDDIFGSLKIWDAMIYNYLRQKNVVIPVDHYRQKVAFEGAFVKEPAIGKHDWVVTLDLASLYPHLIKMFNMSPETIVPDSMAVYVPGILAKEYDTTFLVDKNITMACNGSMYSREKTGIIPDLMTKLYSDRSKAKKKMLKYQQEFEDTGNESLKAKIAMYNNKQMAIKILANSGYGALANNHFRYYDLRIAEGITISGQVAIQWVNKAVNAFMNKLNGTTSVDYIIYSDTDSSFASMNTTVEKYCKGKSDGEIEKFILKFANKTLQEVIDRAYNDLAIYLNAYEQAMKMKVEKIVKSLVMIAKKKYGMLVLNNEGVHYAEPKLKVTGLEIVRSSTPAVIRPQLKTALNEVLTGSEASLQKFIKKFSDIYTQYNISEIAFPRGVNGLSLYSGSPVYSKGCPIHVRGALLYNYYLKKYKLTKKYETIKEGSKIKFVYLKMPNPIRENVIAFIDKLPKEFGLDAYVDYDTMFCKSFVDPMNIVISPLNWSIEEKNTLESFFV